MTDVNFPSTSLLDAINVCLGCLGERPVTSPDNASTNVTLAKQILEEVSRDVQSKGWWFNTSGTDITLYSNIGSGGTENFNASIPEEARRYISIRAARVLQGRFIGSEELQKFSYNEELVSLAILTQAHTRNGGNSTSFTSFPSELKGMGIEEVMFLQQNAEEKLITLRLVTELKTAEKTAAEKELVDAQRSNVQTDTVLKSQQSLTELEETAKRAAEKELVDAQTSITLTDVMLRAQQTLTEIQETNKRTAEKELVDATELKTDAETALMGSQKVQLDAQTAIEATAEKDYYDGVVAGTQNTYRDFSPEMRMMGVQETMFQQTPAYKKVELLKDAEKLRTVTATDTSVDATELLEVNKIMRLIGESPVAALNDHSLASEAVRLLRDTDTELQGRGWYFNTDEDDVITQKPLNEVPQKYLEYLQVRVAILLTELYPQSGIDVQRLPKMEAELRAYFKDREFDDAAYSIFDSYDTSIRVGINRNYDLS